MHCVAETLGPVCMPVQAPGTHHDEALPRREELVFILSGLGLCSVSLVTSFDVSRIYRGFWKGGQEIMLGKGSTH